MTCMTCSMTSITDAEANLYDRQIRLWGLSAQNKIRSSHVVILNALRGVACEVAKNLVLAGVGKLSLIVEDGDLNELQVTGSTAIFIRGGDSDDALTQLKKNMSNLNPHVDIQMHTVSSYKDSLDAYESANVVMATDLLPSSYTAIQAHLNNLTPLYAVGALGLAGYVILLNGSIDANGDEKHYKQLADVLTSKPGETARKMRDKRELLSKWRGWLLVLAWWSWLDQHNRPVTTDESDIEKFHQLILTKANEVGVTQDQDMSLPFDTAEVASAIPSLNTSIAPVHATLGGFMAQDIISAISSKHPGSNAAWNWLSYDATIGAFGRFKV